MIVALRDQGLTKYSVPVPTIGVILVIAFVVGVVAAVVPAWRATKLDILASDRHRMTADGSVAKRCWGSSPSVIWQR